MFLMAFLVISVKFGKHRPLPKRKEDAEKENYKRQNDICRSKCRNSKIFYCVPAYHSHSIIDYKKIHIHLLQFAFLLLILKIKQLYIILKSTTDRCSPKLFTKLLIAVNWFPLHVWSDHKFFTNLPARPNLISSY